MKAPVLIYIAGSAHSGSTLLDLMIGQHPKCLSAGQLGDVDRFLQPGGAINDELLGNEQLGFWLSVLQQLSLEERERIRTQAPAIRKERRLFHYLLSQRVRVAYARAFDTLLGRVLAASPGCEAVIDSTKNVSRAVALRESSHDMVVVHLVRNGRGFLTSKAKRLGDLNSLGVVQFTFYWALKNLLASAILKPLFGDRYLLVRYEDLLADPLSILDRILSKAGLTVSADFRAVISDGRLRRREMVYGNRISKKDTVIFDPKQISRNAVNPKSKPLYFISGGFLERFWGY